MIIILTEAKEQRIYGHFVDIKEYSTDEVGGYAQYDGGNVVIVQRLALRHLVHETPLQQVKHADAHTDRNQQLGQEEQEICDLKYITSLLNNPKDTLQVESTSLSLQRWREMFLVSRSTSLSAGRRCSFAAIMGFVYYIGTTMCKRISGFLLRQTRSNTGFMGHINI